MGVHFGFSAVTFATTLQTGCMQITGSIINGTGTPCASGGGGGTPGGSDTQLQFNKSNTFGATSGLGVDSSSAPTVLNVPFSESQKGPRPYVDVTNPAFGAKGDASTDDTAAINAALTYACSVNAATVFFPPVPFYYKVIQTQTGTSATASPLTIPCGNIALVGGNASAQRPQFGTSPSVTIFAFAGASPNPAPIFNV